MPAFARPLIVLLALAGFPAGAAEPSGDLKLAQLSAQLYAAGQAAGDPVLILTAARLRKEANLSPDLTAETGLGWQPMLDAAQALAKGDPVLTAMISDLRAEQDKGIVSGPEYRIAALAAGASDTRPPVVFRGGEYAEVYVESPAGVDLNLTVLDANGLVVCTDTDRSHVAYCGWTPAAEGAFTLVIENAGTTSADYALMTN